MRYGGLWNLSLACLSLFSFRVGNVEWGRMRGLGRSVVQGTCVRKCVCVSHLCMWETVCTSVCMRSMNVYECMNVQVYL